MCMHVPFVRFVTCCAVCFAVLSFLVKVVTSLPFAVTLITVGSQTGLCTQSWKCLRLTSIPPISTSLLQNGYQGGFQGDYVCTSFRPQGLVAQVLSLHNLFTHSHFRSIGRKVLLRKSLVRTTYSLTRIFALSLFPEKCGRSCLLQGRQRSD